MYVDARCKARLVDTDLGSREDGCRCGVVGWRGGWRGRGISGWCCDAGEEGRRAAGGWLDGAFSGVEWYLGRGECGGWEILGGWKEGIFMIYKTIML